MLTSEFHQKDHVLAATVPPPSPSNVLHLPLLLGSVRRASKKRIAGVFAHLAFKIGEGGGETKWPPTFGCVCV